MAEFCEDADSFGFTKSKVDYRDSLFASMVVRFNLGMRYDEIQKVKTGHVTVSPGVTDNESLCFSIMCKL